eukprot:scaffold7102_cov247-Pinguiococcus_pyrenoidosus.AAC.4
MRLREQSSISVSKQGARPAPDMQSQGLGARKPKILTLLSGFTVLPLGISSLRYRRREDRASAVEHKVLCCHYAAYAMDDAVPRVSSSTPNTKMKPTNKLSRTSYTRRSRLS